MLAGWSVALIFAAELFTRGLAPLQTGAAADQLSAAACVGCHPSTHAEWAGSRHGQAWTNALFQREYRQQPLDWCVHCHAPLREQFQQVAAGGGPLANEGVSCAACHLRDGQMLARTRRPNSPHQTQVRSDFGDASFCAGCHQFNFPLMEGQGAQTRVTGYSRHPMQDTVAQHARGPWSATPCLACHARSPAGHAFPGGHDPMMREKAVALDVCRQQDRLRVSLTNVGAGHNVPTGDLHRHLVLRAWDSGAPERLHETTFGRRFQAAADGGKRTVRDTTLRAGETRKVLVPIARLAQAPDTINLELRLVYTIDEFPFRGREVDEPTWGLMLSRRVRWNSTPRCGVSDATSPLPAESQQLLLVLTDGWSSRHGRLSRWTRRPGEPWRRAGESVRVVVGAAGLGWGRGEHDDGATRTLGGPVKREGDQRAPAGVFRLGEAFGYDEKPPQGVTWPYRHADARLVCVDDPASPRYNGWATDGQASPWRSAERMRLDNDLYRYGLVVQHNTTPVQPGAGSCIFLHVWGAPAQPTVGCTAMQARELMRLLAWLRPADRPLLVQLPASVHRQVAAAWGLPVERAR